MRGESARPGLGAAENQRTKFHGRAAVAGDSSLVEKPGYWQEPRKQDGNSGCNCVTLKRALALKSPSVLVHHTTSAQPPSATLSSLRRLPWGRCTPAI